MRKLLHIVAAAMFCALAQAQVPVAPAVIPHISFVSGVGLPCAGCTLTTYAAGTTTALATYTDSTGTSVNTNPIVLSASGGANIWVGANSYKFILKDALGNTIWSVDNVNAGNLFPCGSSGAVQVANSSAGLSCDSNITINTTTHTLNIGSLPSSHVTIGALGTPTSWTFDTTSPATALASLGAGSIGSGTINQIAIYPAAGSNVVGSSSIPAGVTAITQTPGDNSTKPATTAYVALPGAINPTSLQLASGVAMTANQGNGAMVQHSTGTTVTGNCAKYDANGNTIDSGGPCLVSAAQTNCLASPCAGGTYSTFGGTFTNALSVPVIEEITAQLTGSSGTGGNHQLTSNISGTAGPMGVVANACDSGPGTSITFVVPPGASFTVTPSIVSNCSPAGTWAITNWLEITL